MRAPLSTVTVRAPAKLNLQLCVGPLRADGYHDLTTVFHAVSLYDEVTVRRAEALSVVVKGDTADGVPTGGSNLAVRAVQLLAEEAGLPPHVSLLLHKDIPVAGGCAGGSADAAAALVACDVLWELGLTKEELGVLGGVVSGSGPTVAFLGRDEGHAIALAAGLATEAACRGVRVAHGPVPGARVVRSE